MSALSYSRDGAAAESSLSVEELDRAIRDKRLKAKKLGRRVVIMHSDLENFIASLDDWTPRGAR